MEKKLKSLCVLASSLIPASDASSQIVYTDVNPDSVLFPNEQYNLDLNNDGIFDFDLHVDTIFNIKAIGLRGYGTLDGEMANTISTGNSFYFLLALGAGDYIGPSQNWFSHSIALAVIYGNYAFAPYWHTDQDYFAGLRFKLGANTYYGWVRLQIDSIPLSLTIKDYAYNSIPDQPINADAVLVENASDMSEPSVYAFQQTLTVLLPNENHEVIVSLYDILGEKLISSELNATKSHIPLSDIAAGIYLVTITNGNKHYSKKVRID